MEMDMRPGAARNRGRKPVHAFIIPYPEQNVAVAGADPFID